MPYGLEVRNEAGNVQIDGEYRNLLRIASGSYVGGSYAIYPINFPAQASNIRPLLFVRPANDSIRVGGFWPGGYASASTTQYIVSTTGSFDWVLYGIDSPASMDALNHGLQVFSPSGAVIYDSRYEALRLQHRHRVSGQPWPDWTAGGGMPSYPISVTFTSWGSRPWICMSNMHALADEQGTCWVARTVGLTTVLIEQGVFFGSGPGAGFALFDAGGGGGFGYNRSWPFGIADIVLARRFSD